MKGFLLGLLVASFAFAGFLVWQRHRVPEPAATTKPAESEGPAAARKARKRPRGARRVAAAAGEGASGPGEEPVRLSAADLRPLAQGDDLSRPDVLSLDMSNDNELSELSQDQIDERFRGHESAILDCITRARPDPESYVSGRVTISFRIQRAGTVRGVRVEAPTVLQRNGLFACIKGVVGRLRFPAAGTSQIVTYPFQLS